MGNICNLCFDHHSCEIVLGVNQISLAASLNPTFSGEKKIDDRESRDVETSASTSAASLKEMTDTESLPLLHRVGGRCLLTLLSKPKDHAKRDEYLFNHRDELKQS